MGKIAQYFEKYGVEKKDVVKGIFVFKGLSYLSWFMTLGLCYKARPLQTFFSTGRPRQFLENMKGRYPNAYNKSQNYILTKSEQLVNWQYFKPVPRFFNANSKRFALSLAENMIFYKLALPVLLPIQFWSTVYLIRSRKMVELDIGDRLMDSYCIGTEEMEDLIMKNKEE